MKRLVLGLLLTLPAWSRDAYHISLDVDGDPSLSRQIVGYLYQSLRNISDVAIDSADPDWIIHVVVATTSDMAVMSIVIDEPIRPMVDLMKSKADDSLIRSLLDDIIRATTIKRHMVRIDSKANLEHMCKGLVDQFNLDILDSNRQAVKKANELLKTIP